MVILKKGDFMKLIKKLRLLIGGLSFVLLTDVLTFSVLTAATTPRKISLRAPQFSDADILGGNVGIRPYRKGGINLTRQQLQETTIYHNYGHGGAGASLAAGSVQYVIEQFIAQQHPDQEVAILGAGYMGLMTANALADRGYQVTVYADLVPESQLQIHKACLTSLIAGGLWMPFGIDAEKQEAFYQTLAKNSWDYYKFAIDNKLYQGLKYAKSYNLGRKQEFNNPEEVAIEFGNGQYFTAYEVTTILLDSYVFLNELLAEAKQKGVVFVQYHFADQEALLLLKEKVLFNCLGYGAKTLFNDDNMIAIRGQHLYLRPQPEVDYFLFSTKETGPLSIYPAQAKIASGFSYEVGQENTTMNMTLHEQFKQDLHNFFRDKVLPNTISSKEEL